MRHLISGLVAAVAVMVTAPAMACGYSGCYVPEVYVAPPVVAYTSSGCNPCGGQAWGYERLADPVEQYYYVNQGPTYSGPGAWAPAPVYREGTVSGYAPVYGNGYGTGYRYGYGVRRGIGYGYGARVGYGARYAYGSRYGYHGGARFGGYRGRAHFGRY
jgi:hypothetical protein